MWTRWEYWRELERSTNIRSCCCCCRRLHRRGNIITEVGTGPHLTRSPAVWSTGLQFTQPHTIATNLPVLAMTCTRHALRVPSALWSRIPATSSTSNRITCTEKTKQMQKNKNKNTALRWWGLMIPPAIVQASLYIEQSVEVLYRICAVLLLLVSRLRVNYIFFAKAAASSFRKIQSTHCLEQYSYKTKCERCIDWVWARWHCHEGVPSECKYEYISSLYFPSLCSSL